MKINLVFILHLEIKYFDSDLDTFCKVKICISIIREEQQKLKILELFSWKNE